MRLADLDYVRVCILMHRGGSWKFRNSTVDIAMVLVYFVTRCVYYMQTRGFCSRGLRLWFIGGNDLDYVGK